VASVHTVAATAVQQLIAVAVQLQLADANHPKPNEETNEVMLVLSTR
jgi:hypothetical protein